jgi:hypothetical protein
MISMRESPEPAHSSVLLVGEHFRGPSTRTNACAAQLLSVQRTTFQPIPPTSHTLLI